MILVGFFEFPRLNHTGSIGTFYVFDIISYLSERKEKFL